MRRKPAQVDYDNLGDSKIGGYMSDWHDDELGRNMAQTVGDVLLAVADGIPVVQSVASFLGRRAQQKHQIRTDQATNYLQAELTRHQRHVNRTYVRSADFESLVIQAMEQLEDPRTDSQQFEAVINTLMNAAATGDAERLATRRVLRLLETLAPLQVQILRKLNDVSLEDDAVAFIGRNFTDLPEAECRIQLQELRRMGLYVASHELAGGMLVPVLDESGYFAVTGRQLTARAHELLKHIAPLN